MLDPEHRQTGPPLPEQERREFARLGFTRDVGKWVRTFAQKESSDNRTTAEFMLLIVESLWGLQPEGTLSLDDIPAPDAEWEQIAVFSHTFDGYSHFGGLRDEHHRVRADYEATGRLPDSIEDLRACLFVEFRGDRFTWGDDVVLSEPDAHGVRHFVPNPEFGRSPTQRYRRAIVARLRELARPPLPH